MSTGIGHAQRDILGLLDAAPARSCLTVTQIAEHLGRSRQQIGQAVRSLARRGLVELTLEPTLRVWRVGATEERRDYWMSTTGTFTLLRPPLCGPGCRQQHSYHRRHWT